MHEIQLHNNSTDSEMTCPDWRTVYEMDSFRYYHSHAAGYQVVPKKASLVYENKYSDHI